MVHRLLHVGGGGLGEEEEAFVDARSLFVHDATDGVSCWVCSGVPDSVFCGFVLHVVRVLLVESIHGLVDAVGRPVPDRGHRVLQRRFKGLLLLGGEPTQHVGLLRDPAPGIDADAASCPSSRSELLADV